MDALCVRCGEPWDVYSITDEAEYIGCTPEQAHKRFKREGCGLFGQSCEVNPRISATLSTVADLSGDAGDFAADCELAEMMGLLD